MLGRILLVDDDRDLLEIMSERIEARGMAVATASSANEALERIETEAFDAVIMDFMMPEMDGFKALRAFREKRPGLRIILLTGHATVETRTEAIRLGAVDFIEKPANIELLLKKIKTAKI